MLKLPEPFKSTWIAELRSPDIKQTSGVLWRTVSSRRGMCCLGVAANVIDPYAWSKGTPSYYQYWRQQGTTITGALNQNDPIERQIYNALNQNEPSSMVSVETILTNMNDKGKTFLEIADWIDVNL